MKNTVLKYILTLNIIFIGLFPSLNAQTIYGVSGIIKTPNAYIADQGKLLINGGYFYDYHSKSDILHEQWTVSLNFGFHSRFEIGFRLIGFPGTHSNDPTKRFDYGFDRSYNMKIVLLQEKDYWPQISIGAQDIVGTRYHNSSYLVLSKKLLIRKKIILKTTLGYGIKLNDLILGDAGNHHFIGLFGGVNIELFKRFSILMEYDAKDINTGIQFKNNWFYIKIFNTGFKNFGGMSGVKISI
jgi:hypothetical protein